MHPANQQRQGTEHTFSALMLLVGSIVSFTSFPSSRNFFLVPSLSREHPLVQLGDLGAFYSQMGDCLRAGTPSLYVTCHLG